MNTKEATNKTLLIGQEYPEKDDALVANKIVKLLQDQMLRIYAKKGEKQLRQIHPKMNGCVKAEFIIDPDLPEELKVGIFKEAGSFPAWIRFSNGDTHPLPDWKKDVRGCAIKIMNVPGEKVEGDGVHDFILMNTKNFVSRNIKQFSGVLSVVIPRTTISNIIPKLISIFAGIPILYRGLKAKIKCNHPFEISYFSTVPFRFGDETRAVKYKIKASAQNQLEYTDKSNADFLRHNMAATLMKHEIVYNFFIQFQTDPIKMPVEDPTFAWTSPFIKVATIRIPTQVFNTPEQNTFGDDLSFNPWHCLPEHRPIGSFNRARRIIYEQMYGFRHQHNNIKDKDPEADHDFFKDTNIAVNV